MLSFIRSPKEFWSGVMFMVIGLAAVIIGQDYPMGSAGRMGPAYFPVVLGGILSAIGLVAILRSLWRRGEAVEKFALKQLGLVLLSILLFAILVRGAGMIASVVTLVIVSSLASPMFKWKSAILMAIGSAAFCALVFVKGLGVPMPLIGPWFGF